MGYLHKVKPKMTGGIHQEPMAIAPEAHKEWMDKEGKHVIDKDLKEAPMDLAEREKMTRTKNENVDKSMPKVAPGSHVKPSHRGKAHGKKMGSMDMKNVVKSGYHGPTKTGGI